MDRLGFALSTLCLVHCLLLPTLLAVLPLVAISYVPEWLKRERMAPSRTAGAGSAGQRTCAGSSGQKNSLDWTSRGAGFRGLGSGLVRA